MSDPTRDELNRWAAGVMGVNVHKFDGRDFANECVCSYCGVRSDDSYTDECSGMNFCADLNAAWALAEKVLTPLGHVDLQLGMNGIDGLYPCAIFGEPFTRCPTPAHALTLACWRASNGGKQ